jgi:GAF domain-containing protein
LVKGKELVLGPYHGPLACLRIAYGRGVCGTVWKEGRTIIVPDVEEFPGHIACSSESRSEIVIPLRHEGEIKGVLDIDSEKLATFDDTDALWLEKITDELNLV